MKKFLVICYALHDKTVASCDPFENEDDAYKFLETDAQNTYEEEFNNSNEEQKEQIDFSIDDDGTASLSSCNGEYEWTWQIIELP